MTRSSTITTMTFSTPEGAEVPASAIPEALWGPSWQMRTAQDISGDDPFEGQGARLEWPPGRDIGLDEIQLVTGRERVVLFPDLCCAWVDLSGSADSPAVMRAHWAAWLAPPEEVT
jgi:hypothetical protein